MTNNIVQVNASIVAAPTPGTLQSSGAFISQGATNTSPGTKTLLTVPTSLSTYLTGALSIASITWAGYVSAVTTAAPHDFAIGDTILLTISGATPSGYNGTFLCTITGASTFTYPLASNPGSATPDTGVYTPEDVAELVAMNTTFFAQGSNQSVYVLELGPGNASDGIAYLTAWIAANPGTFYSYLVPRMWAYASSFLTLVAAFEALTAKTYFFTTMALNNYQDFTPLMKSVVGMVEAPATGAWPSNTITAASWSANEVTFTTNSNHGIAVGQWFQISGMTPSGYNGWFNAALGTTGETLIAYLAADPGAESALGTLIANTYAFAGIPATEFSLAAAFYVSLNYAPTSTNQVPPFSFSYLYDVTPFPTQGNSSLLATLKAANVNVVATGAEGGISTAILKWGTTMDGNSFNFWYAFDWAQITGDQAVANAVITGSNSQPPLYYNQFGINALQAVLASTMSNGVSYGLVLGQVIQTELDPATFAQNVNNKVYAGLTVVNAVPFTTYVAANPSAYQQQSYGGLAVAMTPQLGFTQIIFDLTAVEFA